MASQLIQTSSSESLTQVLPVLLQSIKNNGATSLKEGALVFLAPVIQAVMADPALRHFPFSEVSFSEIVFSVIKSGTSIERAALARHLTPEVAFHFLPVASEFQKAPEFLPVAIDQIIKPMFRRLIEHFGCQFVGDQDSVAYSLLTEFEQLSFVDFLIFFERAKNGRYKAEFEHIATRGINAAFLQSWLRLYLDERETAREKILDTTKPSKAKNEFSPENGEKFKAMRMAIEQKQKNRDALIRAAHDIFVEWNEGLYTYAMREQWFKTVIIEVNEVGADGLLKTQNGAPKLKKVAQEIICDTGDAQRERFENFPIRIEKAGSIDRMVKRMIFEFIAFRDSALTVSLFDDLKLRISEKYKGEEFAAKHEEIEMKIILSQFNSLLSKLDIADLVTIVMARAYPHATTNQIGQYIKKTRESLTDLYFDDYLPNIIEWKVPGLTLDHFIISQVIQISKGEGLENPFTQLIK